jgi:hypothetical protein
MKLLHFFVWHFSGSSQPESLQKRIHNNCPVITVAAKSLKVGFQTYVSKIKSSSLLNYTSHPLLRHVCFLSRICALGTVPCL